MSPNQLHRMSSDECRVVVSPREQPSLEIRTTIYLLAMAIHSETVDEAGEMIADSLEVTPHLFYSDAERQEFLVNHLNSEHQEKGRSILAADPQDTCCEFCWLFEQSETGLKRAVPDGGEGRTVFTFSFTIEDIVIDSDNRKMAAV